jgi:hypothetical protein
MQEGSAIIQTEHVIALDPQAHPGDVQQRWHGRLRALDDRSQKPKFRMAAPRTERTFRNWMVPDVPGWDIPLDQGPTPHCVAFTCTELLLAHRIVNRPTIHPAELYARAQKVDEWPGESYDGTSVNAGMKILRELGFIKSWTWAWDVPTVTRHLLEVGPVALGTDWTYGMDETDAHGYVWPTGDIAGGHAYLSIGANMRRKNPDGTIGAIRCLQSWGKWGDRGAGRFWMTLDSLGKLLKGLDPRWPGEAAAPMEVDITP